MWDFVRFEVDASELEHLPITTPQTARTSQRSLLTALQSPLPDKIRCQVQAQIGATVGDVVAAMEFRYSVTRYRVCLKSFLCDGTLAANEIADGTQWFNSAELAELPLSKTGRRVVEWLTNRVT